MSASRKRKSPDTPITSLDDLMSHPQPRKKRKMCISTPCNTTSNTDNTNSNTHHNTHHLNNNSTPNNNTTIHPPASNHASTTNSDDSKHNVGSHTVPTQPTSNSIQFDIRSWGWMDPNPYRSHIKLTNNSTESKGLKIFDLQRRRGHRIVVMDGVTGSIEQSIAFDTWADIYAGIRLRIFLQTLQFKPNKWVVVVIHDSGYNINTEAAWNVLEEWGATKGAHPRHRESYILVLSTNRHQNWWEHIVNPTEYFETKYESAIHSWRKRKKKSKHRRRKRKKDKTRNDAVVFTASQLQTLQSFGGGNVFFEKKAKPGKGALSLKGFLPKMTAIDVPEQCRYTRPNPVQLALKHGIKPCDTETNAFYCVACLNSCDLAHMLVCNDDAHFEDDNAAHVLPKELAKRREIENATAADEINSKFRVRSCGQSFHIYCVTYPDQIWLRWCKFMGVEQVNIASETPAFVELNIKKQHKAWKARNFGGGAKLKLHEKKEEEDINIVNTGNIDFYMDDYAENYRLTPKIRDLTEWFCHSHRRGHQILCRCGNPMVQQLCGHANGETQGDLQKGFRGLYCNNHNQSKKLGCAQYIAPNERLFRCMNGARCAESEDGWDYCMQCIVDNLSKHQPNIRCLCGKRLMLGTLHDVRAIFSNNNDTKPSPPLSNKIKKANTYRCAWCLCKFDNTCTQQQLFYCNQQSNECQRIIKNHFIQFQPFVVCIACVVQSQWMNQTCVCGSNLHCRLLADWIHHDIDAYNENILDAAPPKPNSFTLHHNNNNNNSNNKDDDAADTRLSCKANAYSFYMEQRSNNTERVSYNEMSKKYVHCALCAAQISAYQFLFICNNALKHSGSYYLCGKCAVKQREQCTLFPASNEKVEVCLLFVAHDGVSQSLLWEEWLNETPSIRDKFGVAVQCNNFYALKSGQQFAEKYRIDVQRATQWGKLLVPLTIQKSLQISLTKYPNCRRFYIISGREIPLVSAQHLYAMPNKTQLMAKKITKQTATKLRKKRMGQLLQWYSHHAAMCLQRNHAEMVSVAPWKEYFADSDHIYDHVGAPDEFLFGTTLNAMGVDMRREIWREVTTDFELPTKQDVRHPIHWRNLNEIHEYWKVNELMHIEGKEKKSLAQYLKDGFKKSEKLWGYGPCFFRKISSNVEFLNINKHFFIPWKLCSIQPPQIDKRKGIDETIKYREELNSQAYMDQDEII